MKLGPLRNARDEMARQAVHLTQPVPNNEPQSRSLTSDELALISVGLDQLRDQPAAGELRAQLRRSVTVVLIQKAPF